MTRIRASRFSVLSLLIMAAQSTLGDSGSLSVGGAFPIRCTFDYDTLRIEPQSVRVDCASTPAFSQDKLLNNLAGTNVSIEGQDGTFTIGRDGPSGVRLTPAEGSASNNDPVALPDTQSLAAGQAARIDVVANDTDANLDTLRLDPDTPLVAHADDADKRIQQGATAYYDLVANKVFYQAPAAVTADYTDILQYAIHDNHGGTAEGKLTVNVSAAPPPNVCTNGTEPDCLGKTLDNRWFTVAQELAGAPAGASVFANLSGEAFSMAVFSNPVNEQETQWGCQGPDTTPARDWRSPSRDPSIACLPGSLKPRTYAMRLPVVDGLLPRPDITVDSNNAGGHHRNWVFALSDRPFDLAGNTPADAKACVYSARASTRFTTTTCQIFRDAQSWQGERYLYLMARPAGTDAAKCGIGAYYCRLYVWAWGLGR